jgi:preprotein translocase subunit SecA
MRKMARELGISFNPEDSDNLDTILSLLELKPEHKERLHAVLQAGIPHQVLNARKHTEESQIIAGAGAYGAVTIATNMAGRGVDIKLGGELAEEILAAVNRILSRAGFQNPYDMSMQERRQALLTINKEAYGIYETEIQYFLKYLEEMELVRALGGLHVIGSERHEARRIDNQLRGRSARQGDPGSSRFYLSMEDELMRLFGGQQADGLMQRMRFDDALPLEVGLVSRLVEQAQTRVEGANFDVRKHLLEYDDVLNTQRASIYSQRNRIFIKEDLKDDVTEMLRVEVSRRIPLSLEDEEGPWKLLAWLDQVQPPLVSGIQVFPSYTYRLLVDHLRSRLTNNVDKEAFRAALIDLVKDSLSAEKHHQLRAISSLLETTMDRLESQLEERLEIVDTFFEGLSLEEEGETRRPADILAELSTNVHLPLKLAPDSVHNLIDDPESVVDEIKNQITSVLNTQAIIRVLGAVERRLDELLDINPAQITVGGWDLLFEQITQAVESTFEKRFERYLGPDGQIIKDLENTIARIPYPIVNENLLNQAILQALVLIPQGSRASFDKRTHRRIVQRTTRLSFTFIAAHLLEGREPTEIADDVIHHLESAQDVTCRAWGLAEFNRLSGTTLGEFDAPSRQAILNALGESENSPLLTRTLQNLSPDQQSTIIDELGRRTLTALYRQLLLGVITELWVEYLTQMEALRISIGLEAYAQRDPLVQYKNRAFELYENLLSNMRLGVVSRMFTYRPRDISSVQTGLNREEAQELEVITEATSDAQTSNHERKPEPVEASPTMTSSSGVAQSSNGKKRRRRRR